MKTVLVLAALVALTLGGTVPPKHTVKTIPVDATFVSQQKKILELFYNVNQIDVTQEYYKIGVAWDFKANMDKYTKKEVVEHFLKMYKTGFLPKYNIFSIFNDQHREEAIALFQLFFYAKDFDTFYSTAAWARVHLNEGMFLYSFYIAVMQHSDTSKFVLPAPYEIYPDLFINKKENFNMYRTKQQGGLEFPEIATKFGILKENEDFVFYSNYSDGLTYPNEEQRLAYFTEDIGLNAYYYYFHTTLPFWWNAKEWGPFKERRGEIIFHFYQQLLARYYLERLSNGLGEIPSFSWYSPIRVGYYPFLSTWKYPFAQRSNNYLVHSEKNYEEVRFLDIYEKSFFQFLENGKFKAFEKEIDLHDIKAVNFVGNYWESNADLYGEDFTKNFQRSYEMTARRVLGAAPEPFDKYEFMPSALDFYQTSLRDPVFWQLYNKIFDYMVQYKHFMKPYNHEELHFAGVKITDLKMDKLVTYFDMYDYEAINAVFFSKKDPKPYPHDYKIRTPRLNHMPFSIKIQIKSDVATDASIKLFLGPKIDSNGYPINFEDNWMNFVELDWFTHKLVAGENMIERKSSEFVNFKEDSLPISEIWKLLDEGKLPKDMSEEYDDLPKRLMLPKGTKGGYPYQIFAFVFKHNGMDKKVEDVLEKLNVLLDDKPFGFPLDRPVEWQYFKQPNMFFEDVMIYHEGATHTYKMANPEYKFDLKV